MQHTKRIYFALGLALAATTMIGTAAADQPTTQPGAPETTSMAQKMSATATVEKVDTDDRNLVLKDEQGNEFKVHVSDDVTRFDAIKKGDRIKVDYYQSIALSLKKGGEGMKPSASETTAGQRTAGDLPGGVMARRMTVSAMVTKVDPAKSTVTLKGPEGDMTTVNVTDPAMKDDLSKLKKGDKIQATYTEAVAIAVMPAEKKKG